MRRLFCGAIFALTFAGAACGPEIELQEPIIAPYDGEPAIGFSATTTEAPAPASTTAVPTTTIPTTAAPTTALPTTAVPTTAGSTGGFVLDLGDIDDSAPTTTGFILDITGVTAAPLPSTTALVVPDDASPFCRAAGAAHAMVVGDNAANVSMTAYAAALREAADLAPAEVAEFYADLAAFTQKVADLVDYPEAAADADSLFARQPAANTFVLSECGFEIL